MKYKWLQENVYLPLSKTREDEMFTIINQVLGIPKINVQYSDLKSRLPCISGVAGFRSIPHL